MLAREIESLGWRFGQGCIDQKLCFSQSHSDTNIGSRDSQRKSSEGWRTKSAGQFWSVRMKYSGRLVNTFDFHFSLYVSAPLQRYVNIWGMRRSDEGDNSCETL